MCQALNRFKQRDDFFFFRAQSHLTWSILAAWNRGSQVFLTSYSSNPQMHPFFPSGATKARGKIDFTDMHSELLKWQLQTTKWLLVRAALRVQLNMKIGILTVFAILSWKMPVTERKGVRLFIAICKHKTKNYEFTLQVTGSIFKFSHLSQI